MPRSFRQLARIAAAQLQRHRMLGRVESEQPRRMPRTIAAAVIISVYSSALGLSSRRK